MRLIWEQLHTAIQRKCAKRNCYWKPYSQGIANLLFKEDLIKLRWDCMNYLFHELWSNFYLGWIFSHPNPVIWGTINTNNISCYNSLIRIHTFWSNNQNNELSWNYHFICVCILSVQIIFIKYITQKHPPPSMLPLL